MSRKPATRALFVPFLTTNSRSSALRLGCFSTTSRSCSLGSCRSAPNDCGAMSFAQRMKPSQSGGFVQIFFVISRESSVVETKPRSERYVVTAWMTCRRREHQSRQCGRAARKGATCRRTVRRKSVGRFGSSTSWFMTTPRISERKMSVIEKQMVMAARGERVRAVAGSGGRSGTDPRSHFAGRSPAPTRAAGP